MLEAVTYRKELILSIFMLSERDQLWADQVGTPARPYAAPRLYTGPPRLNTGPVHVSTLQALQLHSELQSHGYGHFLFVASNEEACTQVSARETGCMT